MKKIYSVLVFTFFIVFSFGQVSITATGAAFTQNFDGIGSAASATLPTGFKIGTDWSLGTTVTSFAAGSTGTGALTTTSSGGVYNYANGINASSTDRAIGFLTSGSFLSPRSIVLKLTNNTGANITDLAIAYDYEKYRNGTRAFDWSFFHGSTVSPTTADALGNQSYSVDAAITVLNPPTTISKSFSLTGLSIPSGADYYLRWTFTGVGGSSNSQGLAIDNFSVTANGNPLPPCAEPSTQPTNLILNAASNNVTGAFTIIPSPTTVENYLVVRSLSNTLTQFPQDGTNYTAGQILNSGNGTVIANSNDGTFTDNTVLPSTIYYYFIFALEDQACSGAPNYNIITSLTSSATTPALSGCIAPNAPTALSNPLAASNTTIGGTFTGSGASKYLVIRTTSASLTLNPNNSTLYTAGQTIGNGTVVSYNANATFSATGLTPATLYYFFIFAANEACTGAPFYSALYLDGSQTTTNNATGIPPGYYATVNTQTCSTLKTVLFDIVKPTVSNPAPTYDGICTMYPTTDFKVSDFSSNNVIWDMYSDNPTGPDPYEFEYQVDVDGCGGSGANNPPIPGTTEGILYNREHSFPRSWFGGDVEPMNSDALHIFPTDKQVNALRGSFPFGKVISPTTTTLNGSKIGPNSTTGFSGTVFEPIDAYKGDFARSHFYMITAYEDKVAAWQPNKTEIFNGNVYTAFDDWYLLLMYQWHIADPVSAKEIDRNNAVYLIQGNRNPYIDHPEYVNAVFQCASVLPVLLTNFVAKLSEKSILLNWYVTSEASFKKYEIQRSIDGITFNAIGEVEGRNLVSYNFTDNDLPRNVIVYYRLKMIDVDGQFKNSKIISVKLNANSSNAVVYPNPTTESLYVKLYVVLHSNSVLQVTDIAGRTIMQQRVNVSDVNIRLDVKNLSAGRYFIKIANDKQIINQSFVIMK
jgi:endonuclease I